MKIGLLDIGAGNIFSIISAFNKLNIPFNLAVTESCGPQYQPELLYQFFEPIDSHWNAALE